jgi:Flp pilus assembly protein CpaB
MIVTVTVAGGGGGGGGAMTTGGGGGGGGVLHHVKVLAIDQLVNERQEQPTVPKAPQDQRQLADIARQ